MTCLRPQQAAEGPFQQLMAAAASNQVDVPAWVVSAQAFLGRGHNTIAFRVLHSLVHQDLQVLKIVRTESLNRKIVTAAPEQKQALIDEAIATAMTLRSEPSFRVRFGLICPRAVCPARGIVLQGDASVGTRYDELPEKLKAVAKKEIKEALKMARTLLPGHFFSRDRGNFRFDGSSGKISHWHDHLSDTSKEGTRDYASEQEQFFHLSLRSAHSMLMAPHNLSPVDIIRNKLLFQIGWPHLTMLPDDEDGVSFVDLDSATDQIVGAVPENIRIAAALVTFLAGDLAHGTCRVKVSTDGDLRLLPGITSIVANSLPEFRSRQECLQDLPMRQQAAIGRIAQTPLTHLMKTYGLDRAQREMRWLHKAAKTIKSLGLSKAIAEVQR